MDSHPDSSLFLSLGLWALPLTLPSLQVTWLPVQQKYEELLFHFARMKFPAHSTARHTYRLPQRVFNPVLNGSQCGCTHKRRVDLVFFGPKAIWEKQDSHDQRKMTDPSQCVQNGKVNVAGDERNGNAGKNGPREV